MAAAAALSIGIRLSPIQELKKPRNSPRIFILMCCQRGDPVDDARIPRTKKEVKQERQQVLRQVFWSVEKFGKGLKDTLSPKQKGDWKDVVLMSLSFAVYVYISQKLVCAYCVWMSMLNNHQW